MNFFDFKIPDTSAKTKVPVIEGKRGTLLGIILFNRESKTFGGKGQLPTKDLILPMNQIKSDEWHEMRKLTN